MIIIIENIDNKKQTTNNITAFFFSFIGSLEKCACSDISTKQFDILLAYFATLLM